jgi:hypothetical protein
MPSAPGNETLAGGQAGTAGVGWRCAAGEDGCWRCSRKEMAASRRSTVVWCEQGIPSSKQRRFLRFGGKKEGTSSSPTCQDLGPISQISNGRNGFVG